LQKLEEFYLPQRERQRGGAAGIEADVVAYYQDLPPKDKRVMREAVLEWLNQNDWRLREAIALCGLLRIRQAAGRLLALGAQYAPVEGDWQADSTTRAVVAALGELGDRIALPFLRGEAAPCGEREPKRSSVAILALSRIAVDEGLRFLPCVVRGDVKYRGKRALDTEDTTRYGHIWGELNTLLSFHDKGIVSRLAWHLRNLSLEEKRFVLSAFKHALDTAYVFKRDARFMEPEKGEMLQEFERGLGLGEDLAT
jgi:hypothetical protein